MHPVYMRLFIPLLAKIVILFYHEVSLYVLEVLIDVGIFFELPVVFEPLSWLRLSFFDEAIVLNMHLRELL